MGGEPWPFLGQEAVRRGQLSARQLQKDYQSVYRNVYLPKGTLLTALTRARAAWLWSAGEATLVGLSAAAVLGTKWIDPQAPAELSRADRHSPKGIVAHTYDLTDDECCLVDGMRITTPVRTAFDIGRSMRRDHAVVHLDALTHATDLKIRDVLTLADGKRGLRGVRKLRKTLAFVDGGAESPQETRVRLLFMDAGLPVPEIRSSSQMNTASSGYVSIWGGANGRSPSNTTASSTGRTSTSGRGT